jgi:[NiFe] hydrogenase assembly HybE family chaperone
MTAESADPADVDLAGRLVALWQAAAVRMADVPICNPALAVQSTGVRRLGAWRFAVVVTPWFMNLVAVPDAEITLPADGAKLTLDLPAGPVELVLASDATIGRYASASLFSPMDEFHSPDETAEVAAACLDELCRVPANRADTRFSAPVDRRALLRLGLGR